MRWGRGAPDRTGFAKIKSTDQGLPVIAYSATLDVSRELAQWVSRLLAAERRRRGTRKGSRVLTGFRQAVLGLRWFRQDADITTLGRDHGTSRATASTGMWTRSSVFLPIRPRTCTKPWNAPRLRAWPT